MSGVPRIIQTKVLVSQRIGLNRVMDPSVITSPSGIARRSVTAKSFRFSSNPPFREASTALVVVIRTSSIKHVTIILSADKFLPAAGINCRQKRINICIYNPIAALRDTGII
jgi:hypothetical protein